MRAWSRLLLLVLSLSALELTGCGQKGPAAPPAKPPDVTVSLPIQKEITDYAEYPGRTASVDALQVRARVSGYLQEINYKEGDEVKAGDVLYVIDPRPYKAALDQTEAQVRVQQATLTYQEALYARNRSIAGAGAVSREELQQTLEQRNVTQANLEAAQAAVAQSKLNLEWTQVKAQVAGRIGRTLVTKGNLVVADQTLLTTIVSQDPMYAYFDVDEPTVLRVQQLIREGKYKSAREPGNHVPVYLGLSTEEGYPHEGSVDFINNQVLSGTGTLTIRGVFANPAPPTGPRLLSPGLFVRIRIAVSAPYRALLVSQAALGTDQNYTYLYVVDDQNQVVRKNVKLGSTQDNGLQVITDGLDAKDRVIVVGTQLAHPGAPVNPKEEPMPVGAAAQRPAGQSGGTVPPVSGQPQPAPNMQQNYPPRGQTR